ncbi:MAG: hypothetical protein EOO20_00270 [Chryseobacterium sp.]|nr:MAG: hypothetical protein EOO20_00270 [Chryseobacterium sp.]
MKKVIENLKSVNKFGLVLILVAAGVLFSQSAFRSPLATMTYQYEEDDDSFISDPNHWRNTDVEPQLECSEGSTLPCIVQFEDSEYASIDAFLAENDDVTKILGSGNTTTRKLNVNP